MNRSILGYFGFVFRKGHSALSVGFIRHLRLANENYRKIIIIRWQHFSLSLRLEIESLGGRPTD